MDLERERNEIYLLLYILPDREKGYAIDGSEKFDGGSYFVERVFQVLECIAWV